MRALIRIDRDAARRKLAEEVERAGGRLNVVAERLDVGHRTVCEWVEELGMQHVVVRARKPTNACECGHARANHAGTTPHQCALCSCAGYRGSGERVVVKRVTCSEAGCSEPVLSRGFCQRHYYQRWRAKKAAAS